MDAASIASARLAVRPGWKWVRIERQ